MGAVKMQMSHFVRNISSVNKCAPHYIKAREAAWLPGSQAPAHLDGSLPGDFVFDPLGLGKQPQTLKWYQQAEVQHARWAMLAVAGILMQSIVKPDVSFMDAGKVAVESSYA